MLLLHRRVGRDDLVGLHGPRALRRNGRVERLRVRPLEDCSQHLLLLLFRRVGQNDLIGLHGPRALRRNGRVESLELARPQLVTQLVRLRRHGLRRVVLHLRLVLALPLQNLLLHDAILLVALVLALHHAHGHRPWRLGARQRKGREVCVGLVAGQRSQLAALDVPSQGHLHAMRIATVPPGSLGDRVHAGPGDDGLEGASRVRAGEVGEPPTIGRRGAARAQHRRVLLVQRGEPPLLLRGLDLQLEGVVAEARVKVRRRPRVARARAREIEQEAIVEEEAHPQHRLLFDGFVPLLLRALQIGACHLALAQGLARLRLGVLLPPPDLQLLLGRVAHLDQLQRGGASDHHRRLP